MRDNACGRCGYPIDDTDPRHDGRARHEGTPWCRRCVSDCHEATDFAHECPVCTYTGEVR